MANTAITTSITAPTARRPPQIRHAGHAHVRGKIRRVWRPRYLELWDNGLVRYYEQVLGQPHDHPNGTSMTNTSSSSSAVAPTTAAAATNTPTSSSRCRLRREQKYTLAIFHARILDPTTFRDMHVGLPASCYGFVFRGQRLVHLEMHNSASAADAAAAEIVVVQHERDPRDFLCAVASLEDAQMWVVALQWAAMQQSGANLQLIEPWWNTNNSPQQQQQQQRRQQRPGGVTRRQSTPSSLATDVVSRHRPQRTMDDDDDMLGVQILESCNSSIEEPSPSKTPTTVLQSSREQQQQSLAASATAIPSVVDNLSSSKNQSSTSMDMTPSLSAAPFRRRRRPRAVVVVTKVVQFRAVRFQWQDFRLAYEIHVLLVRGEQPTQAEQWSILRTAADLQALVRHLSQELGPAVVDQALGGRKQRQALVALQQPPAVEHSLLLQRVDKIVRELVMNGQVVNAVALKAFLGLGSTNVQSLSMRFLLPYDGRSILQARQPVLIRENVDQFVKKWLQERSRLPQSQLDETSLRVLDILGGTLGWWGWVAVPLATHWCQRYIPTVSIRMDFLVLSWVGAAYAGSLCGRRHDEAPTPTGPQIRPARTAKPTRTEPSESSLMESTQNQEDGSPVIIRDYSDRTDESDGDDGEALPEVPEQEHYLSSPLPKYPANGGSSCWSQPDAHIFYVRGATYLKDKIKEPSRPAPLTCRGVDVWMTDTAERHIARHPSVLGGKLGEEDTFLVNFLLPFGNLVAYFSIPPLDQFPPKLRTVWTRFLEGDQEYRDKRLKLLPVVAEGPWIVKAAVGPGKAPAVLGKVIPLQYFFRDATPERKGVYEVDVIITASTIAKGILSVVKGHTKSVSIAFAFIIEGTGDDELPENVLCCFQVHTLHLEDCPLLPACRLDDEEETD